MDNNRMDVWVYVFVWSMVLTSLRRVCCTSRGNVGGISLQLYHKICSSSSVCDCTPTLTSGVCVTYVRYEMSYIGHALLCVLQKTPTRWRTVQVNGGPKDGSKEFSHSCAHGLLWGENLFPLVVVRTLLRHHLISEHNFFSADWIAKKKCTEKGMEWFVLFNPQTTTMLDFVCCTSFFWFWWFF